MIDTLYQKAILRHAAAAVGNGKLDNPDRIQTTQNPLCGDRITLYLQLDGEKIAQVSHETKACVLCQATASILTQCATGETEQIIDNIHEDLKKGLKEKNLDTKQWPDDKWNALNIFHPVSEHQNRFTCVTLPFESMLKALRGQD